jgi:hypothetical protein
MTARATDVAFRCLECSFEWPERRTTARLGPHCAPASEATHAAVQAICGATETTTIAAATLRWTRRLTHADGAAFCMRESAAWYYLDAGDVVEERTATAAGCVWVPQQPALISDLPAAATSAVIVPVQPANPIASLIAYWNVRPGPTVWHVETMELLADAAALRLR